MKFRYPLAIIAALCGQIAAGVVLMGISYFIDPITADLWSDGSVSRSTVQSYYTVALLTSMAIMPIAGRIITRVGSRILLLVSGLIGAFGLFVGSLANGMAVLALSGIIIGVGLGIGVNFVPVVLVNTWFERLRGPLTGLVLAGTGLGGIVAAQVLPSTVPAVADGGLGWRTALLILAGIFAAFSVIPAIFFVTNRPADVGLPIYGLALNTDESGQIAPPRERMIGLRQSEALRSPWFWVLYAAITVLGVYYAMGQILNPFLVNQASYPGSGVTPSLITLLMTVHGVGLILTKPVVGLLWESIGLFKAMGIVMVVHAVAGWLLGSLIFPAPGLDMVYMALVGTGFALGTVTPPLVCAIAFGQREYSAIWGVLATAYWLGVAFGAIIWSVAGTIGAEPGQPWQLYRFAMQWCWVLGLVGIAGYGLAIRGGRRTQLRLHPEDELPPARL